VTSDSLKITCIMSAYRSVWIGSSDGTLFIYDVCDDDNASDLLRDGSTPFCEDSSLSTKSKTNYTFKSSPNLTSSSEVTVCDVSGGARRRTHRVKDIKLGDRSKDVLQGALNSGHEVDEHRAPVPSESNMSRPRYHQHRVNTNRSTLNDARPSTRCAPSDGEPSTRCAIDDQSSGSNASDRTRKSRMLLRSLTTSYEDIMQVSRSEFGLLRRRNVSDLFPEEPVRGGGDVTGLNSRSNDNRKSIGSIGEDVRCSVDSEIVRVVNGHPGVRIGSTSLHEVSPPINVDCSAWTGRFKLQSKVKVSEWPVKQLIDAGYSCVV